MHHRDLAAKLGKQNRLLEGGVSAADDGHVLPLVEGSVANGAKGNAVSDDFFFVFDAEQTVLCPRGDYDGLAFKVSAVGDDGLDLSVLYGGNLGHFHVGSEGQRLLHKLFGKFVARKGSKSGDVFNLGGKGYLSSEGLLLYNKNRFSGSFSVNCGGQPRRAAADDYNVIHLLHPKFS